MPQLLSRQPESAASLEALLPRISALAVLLILVGHASAAGASTIPPIDLEPGDTAISAGILDVSVDHAATDRWSVGATLNPGISASEWYAPILSPLAAAVRSSFRISGDRNEPAYGITLSSGVAMAFPQTQCGPGCWPYDLRFGLPYILRAQYWAFVQPAFNASVPIGEYVTIRGTLGPIIILNGRFGFEPRLIPLPWPNLELAVKTGKDSEFTLLGNSLLGWRTIF